MIEKEEIQVEPIKGRPRLTWTGKEPIRTISSFPAQHIEEFSPTDKDQSRSEEFWQDWPKAYPKSGLLFHGDNKEVLAHLLANGFRRQVDLIFIDPPFNTGVNYIRKVTLRGVKMEKLESEGYSFTEQIQYENNWHIDAYLQFLYERLQLAKELLADNGIIFIRMDIHFGHFVRLICDEVFGPDRFQNTLIVNRVKKNVTKKGRRTIPHAVDYVFVYFKSGESTYKDVLKRLPETKPGYWHGMDSPGIPGPRKLVLGEKTYFPAPGTHLKFTQDQAEEMWEIGELREKPSSGNLEYWVPDKDYINLDSNWSDIPGYTFKTGYPTENSEQLLERVILAGSKPGDLVLDFFVGSGTTAKVAQKLGRRWIACDINKGSIQTTSKRLQSIILEQIGKKKRLVDKQEFIIPQHQFSIYRVNDYNLHIQHNEAIELACDHIGIQRTSTDHFFNGTLGKKLVKINPFNRPLSPLDLEEIKTEISSRPDEDRDVVVVSLGKQLAVDTWIEDWNKLRKKGNVPNKIEAIELRTDPKYGKLFTHKPPEAKVQVKRKDQKIIITIQEYISPTVIERLSASPSFQKIKIDDWRVMVDSVMIDLNHDGELFRIEYADVPPGKVELVEGRYELTTSEDITNVAVKITDVLGEEIIVVKDI